MPTNISMFRRGIGVGWRRTSPLHGLLLSVAGVLLYIDPGRECLLRRVTTRGHASDALSEGQYSEALGPDVLLLLLLLLLLSLSLVGGAPVNVVAAATV